MSKIDGTGRPISPNSLTRPVKGGAGGSTKTSGFDGMVHTSSNPSVSITPTQAIAGIDALLVAQESEDPASRASRQRMRIRAEKILAALETMRLALLSGHLRVGHMIDIADVIASHRERIMDPALTQLMDDIDLRAQVELAKLRGALDRSVGSM